LAVGHDPDAVAADASGLGTFVGGEAREARKAWQQAAASSNIAVTNIFQL